MLRRLTVRWLLVALVAALTATAAAAPTTASARAINACPAIYPRPAYCDGGAQQFATAGLRHVGWTYLNLNYCAPGYACAMIYRISTPAWRWNGRSWVSAQLPGGWVYVYPYTGNWRWAWTQQTGWLAVSGGRFELR